MGNTPAYHPALAPFQVTLITFDGHRFDYQGTCVYQLVAVCTQKPGLVPFKVTVQKCGLHEDCHLRRLPHHQQGLPLQDPGECYWIGTDV